VHALNRSDGFTSRQGSARSSSNGGNMGTLGYIVIGLVVVFVLNGLWRVFSPSTNSNFAAGAGSDRDQDSKFNACDDEDLLPPPYEDDFMFGTEHGFFHSHESQKHESD
jgi:hypothetical protein